MVSSQERIARAFSGHRFAETYEHLAQDIAWELVGGSPLRGRSAVIAACEQTSAGLSGVTTELRRFTVVVGSEAVAVDSLTTYVDADEQATAVASCDIYQFAGDEVVSIVSYTVEVDAD